MNLPGLFQSTDARLIAQQQKRFEITQQLVTAIQDEREAFQTTRTAMQNLHAIRRRARSLLRRHLDSKAARVPWTERFILAKRSVASVALVLLVPFLCLGQMPLTNLPAAPDGPMVIPIPIAWDYPAVSYPASTRVEWWTNGGGISNSTVNSRPLSNFLAVPVPTAGRWNIRAAADYGNTQLYSATISAVITNPVTVTLGNLSGTTQQVVWVGPPPITNRQAYFRANQKFYWKQLP